MSAWKPIKAIEDDFYVLSDGSKRLRVTRVIGAMSKEALGPWAAKLAAEEAWSLWSQFEQREMDKTGFIDQVKNAAVRYTTKTALLGTKVHDAIEKIINDWLAGIEYPADESLYDRDIQGHIRGFLAWCKQYQPTWVAAEYRLCNASLMGTCDAAAIVDLGNGKGPVLTIMDFKTGKSIHAESVSLQLACYRHLPVAVIDGQEMENFTYEQAAVLHIRPRSFNMYEVEAGPRQYAVFQYAFEVWKHMNLEADNLLGQRISVER